MLRWDIRVAYSAVYRCELCHSLDGVDSR